MDYKDTLKRNISRLEKLVDENIQQAEEGFPLFNWLEISPVDKCNRRCVFCPRSDPSTAPNLDLHMAEPLYRKIADELSALSYRGSVMLAGYGEPMLHRDITKMAAVFSGVAHTEITVNGDLLTPRKLVELSAAGIGKIIVSLYDGPEQVERFETMVREAGIGEELVILRDRWYREADDFGIKLTNRGGTVSAGNQPEVGAGGHCFYPHYMMMVDWNGDVFLCTQDWNRRVRFGNLMYDPITRVWNSDGFRRYRRRLAAGRRSLLPCAGCNADGTLHGYNHVKLWERYYEKEHSR